MSHSESEGEFEPTDDKPMFPYEKLYHDAKDKAKIQAMPEIERESILASRSEMVDRHEQDAQLRRLLASRAKDAAKAEARNKRKASAADLEEHQRKSSRQRLKLGGGKAGEPSSAIAAYKKHREEKTLREEQRKARLADRRLASPEDDYSEGDAEAESDNDYADRRHKRRSPTPPKDDPVVELNDIQRVRVGRDNFAQVCWTPGFQETITNCYARVCLGPGRTPGMNEYRLCSIKGFQDGRPYAMTAPNGKSFIINQYIIAAHGKATRPWSFLECSNSRFTDDEWRRYRLTMANEDCRMPTKGQINAKLEQINKLISYRFNDAEISEKLKKQNALVNMVEKTTERKEIKEKILAAQDNGDEGLVAELEDQLANIVPMKLAFNTSLSQQNKNAANEEADRLAELNRRNQRMTAENIRKAQQKRIYKKKAVFEPNKLMPLGPDDDLFASASDISRSGTPVNGMRAVKAEVASGTSTPARLTVQDAVTSANGNDTPRSITPSLVVRANEKPKKGLPTIKKTKRDDEVLETLDLGIDIDL